MGALRPFSHTINSKNNVDLNIQYIINKFAEKLMEDSTDTTTTSNKQGDKDQSSAGKSASVSKEKGGSDAPSDTKRQEEELDPNYDYRVVSRTLKSVLNPNIHHKLFLETIVLTQHITRIVMVSLSEIVPLITNWILDGKFQQTIFSTRKKDAHLEFSSTNKKNTTLDWMTELLMA
jgi:hypothetical protein